MVRRWPSLNLPNNMNTITIDASNQSLGRLSTKIAILLRGKNLVSYTPNQLPDTQVVISNIDKIKFTGNKMETKKYHRYSGYPGGIRTRTLGEWWAKHPQEVVRHSVYRMLPKNKMRDKIITHLKFK